MEVSFSPVFYLAFCDVKVFPCFIGKDDWQTKHESINLQLDTESLKTK